MKNISVCLLIIVLVAIHLGESKSIRKRDLTKREAKPFGKPEHDHPGHFIGQGHEHHGNGHGYGHDHHDHGDTDTISSSTDSSFGKPEHEHPGHFIGQGHEHHGNGNGYGHDHHDHGDTDTISSSSDSSLSDSETSESYTTGSTRTA